MKSSVYKHKPLPLSQFYSREKINFSDLKLRMWIQLLSVTLRLYSILPFLLPCMYTVLGDKSTQIQLQHRRHQEPSYFL